MGKSLRALRLLLPPSRLTVPARSFGTKFPTATSSQLEAHTLFSGSPYFRLHATPTIPLNNDEGPDLTPTGAAIKTPSMTLERDVVLYPNFFNPDESRELLAMALWKLDRVDSTRKRQRRRPVAGSSLTSAVSTHQDQREQGGGQGPANLQDLFEGEYGFEEGHYDSVIHHYRETLLSSLPPDTSDTVRSLLQRLYALLPMAAPASNVDRTPVQPKAGIETEPRVDQVAPAQAVQVQLPPASTLTHLLHLAPHGAILPHVDNLDASGSIIIGVSLGAERILRLQRKGGGGGGKGMASAAGHGVQGWDVRLPSGSVYLQKDTVRYEYDHSILGYNDDASNWDGEKLDPGHRVSIMIRDAPTRPSKL